MGGFELRICCIAILYQFRCRMSFRTRPRIHSKNSCQLPVFLEDDEHEEAYEIVVTLLFVLVVVLVLDNMVT